MRKPKLMVEIAKQLRRFHEVEIPGSREPQLWNDISKFFSRGVLWYLSSKCSSRFPLLDFRFFLISYCMQHWPSSLMIVKNKRSMRWFRSKKSIKKSMASRWPSDSVLHVICLLKIFCSKYHASCYLYSHVVTFRPQFIHSHHTLPNKVGSFLHSTIHST